MFRAAWVTLASVAVSWAATTALAQPYIYYDGRGECPPGYQHENYGCVPNPPRCPPGYSFSEYGYCEPEAPPYRRRYRRYDGRAGSGVCPPGYQHENYGCVPLYRRGYRAGSGECPPGYQHENRGCVPFYPRGAGSGECPPGYQHENQGCVPFRR